MFTPFTLRGVDAEEPHRRLADGAVLVRRRHARRLPPGAPRRARDGRRRHGRRRDDLPVARRAHHARPARACGTRRSATPGSASSTSSTPTATRRSRCSSATPAPRARPACRGKARTSRSPTGNWPLISASPQQYLDGVSDWSRGDDARRHGPRARRLRPRDALRRRGRLRLARAALRARLPAVVVHLAAHQPAHRRVRRLAREPAALSARGVRARCARSGRSSCRSRCGSRRTTGSRAASRPTTRSRSRAPSRPPAPT